MYFLCEIKDWQLQHAQVEYPCSRTVRASSISLFFLMLTLYSEILRVRPSSKHEIHFMFCIFHIHIAFR